MKKFKVTGTETVWYEKIVEAKNEDEAYNTYIETLCDEDIVDSCNFEVHDIVEVKDDKPPKWLGGFEIEEDKDE